MTLIPSLWFAYDDHFSTLLFSNQLKETNTYIDQLKESNTDINQLKEPITDLNILLCF